jgi:gliding motility-associated-like protein
LFGFESLSAQTIYRVQNSTIASVDIDGDPCFASNTLESIFGAGNLSDIAAHPNGLLYVINALGIFYSVDPSSWTNQEIGPITGILQGEQLPGLVATSNGTFLAASRTAATGNDGRLYEITTAGVATNLGTLPVACQGDLAYHQGQLYMIGTNPPSSFNNLVLINEANPSASTVLGDIIYPGFGGGELFGMISKYDQNPCDPDAELILANAIGIFYTIDLETLEMTRICGGNGQTGLAYFGEHLAAEPCGCSATANNQDFVRRICGGETIDLPELGQDIGISNSAGNQLGDVQWFQTNSPNGPAFSNIPQAYTGSGCSTEQRTIYGFVLCEGQDWLPVASVDIFIYPMPEAPMVSRINDNCDYTLVANCANETLSPASIPSVPPGTAATTQTITVTSQLPDHPCPSASFTVTIDECPEQNCSLSSNHVPSTEYLCDGETVGLPVAGIDYTINDPAGSQVGMPEWFTQEDITSTPFTNGPQVHTGGECSSSDLQTVYAFAGCDQNGDGSADAFFLVATHTFQTFPDLITPVVTRDNDNCDYSIFGNCTSDILGPNTVADIPPGSMEEQITVTVTSMVPNHPCPTRDFTVVLESCPSVGCAISSDHTQSVEALCDGGTPALPIAGQDFSISDPNGTVVGDVEWFEEATTDSAPFINGPQQHNTGACSASPVATVYGFIGCDTDMDGVADEFVQVVSHAFQTYPQIGEPVITRNDDECNYTISGSCQDDEVSITSINFLPGAANEAVTVTVQSALTDHPCPGQTFMLTVEDCPSAGCNISSDVNPVTELLCDGETPVLPVAGVDYQINDPGGTSVGDVIWRSENSPTAPLFNNGPQMHTTGVCAASPILTVYGFIGCDADQNGTVDEQILIGTHSFITFPDLSAPTILRLDDECTYQIEGACAADNITPQSIATQSPGTSATEIEVTVTSGIPNHPCPQEAFTVTQPDCPSMGCMITSSANESNEFICSGEVLTLLVEGENFTIIDPANNRVGEVVWFDNSSATGNEFINLPLQYEGQGCTPDPERVLYAFIGCDTDGDGISDEYVEVARHSYTVYPPVISSTVERLDGQCNYRIIPACEESQVEGSPNIIFEPGTSGEQISVTIVSELPEHPCPEATFLLDVPACPFSSCSITADFNPIDTIRVCEWTAVQLPTEGEGYVINDEQGTRNGEVEWVVMPQGGTPVAFSEASFVLEDCTAPLTIGVFGAVGCDLNFDGIPDEMIQVGNFTVELFPPLNSPLVERTSNLCEYQIIPACNNHLLETTAFSPPCGFLSAGELSITVTSSYANHPCSPELFEVPYESCPQPGCQLMAVQGASFQRSGGLGDTIVYPTLRTDVVLTGETEHLMEIPLIWSEEETTPETSFTGVQLPYRGDGCLIDDFTLYGYASCDYDCDGTPDAFTRVTTLSYRVSPPVLPPRAIQNPETCIPRVISNCANEQVVFDTVALLSGISSTLAVTIINPVTSTANSFDVPIDPCNYRSKIKAFLPNAFSPNQDGINDEFTVFANPELIDYIGDFRVSDRWGGLMYEAEGSFAYDDKPAWAGGRNGKAAASGVYYYTLLVKYRFVDEPQMLTGQVTLLR